MNPIKSALAANAPNAGAPTANLVNALRDGIPLQEPVHIAKALLAQRKAHVVLSGGNGPSTCVMLCNIQLTGWGRTKESSEAFAEGYNTAFEQYRGALLGLAAAPAQQAGATASSAPAELPWHLPVGVWTESERDALKAADAGAPLPLAPSEVVALPLVPIEDHNRLTAGPAVYTDTRVPAKSFNVARGVFGTGSEEDDKRVYRTLQAAFHAAGPSGVEEPTDAMVKAMVRRLLLNKPDGSAWEDVMRLAYLDARALAAPQQALPLAPSDWWRKRADEIEAWTARTGSTDAMRCFTDMRTLLQSATAATPPQATLPASEAEMRAILQELHDKFNTRVYGTGSYIKRNMRDRIAAVLATQAPSAAKERP